MRSQAIERPRRSHASRALKATAAAVVAAVVGALVVVVPAQAATTDDETPGAGWPRRVQ